MTNQITFKNILIAGSAGMAMSLAMSTASYAQNVTAGCNSTAPTGGLKLPNAALARTHQVDQVQQPLV